MTSGSKLVSVIMPCFNAGPMLRPALRSVLDQTYPHLEIIFVDNNSTDGSRRIAEGIAQEASRPIRIVDCPQQGVNHARNLGFGFAGGDYIQWMDADDRLDPDKIALQIAALDTNPHDDIAYGDWTSHWSEPSRPPRSRRHNLAQDDDQVRRTLAGVWYPPHLYLLRRKAAQALQDADGWWPGRPVGTDVEYSAVAALMGLRFRHVPGAHVHYNIWSNGQISEGTPYDLRVRTLGEIFDRLERMVERGEAKVRLGRRHKLLLKQTWDIVRLPRGSVALTQGQRRRVQLRHLHTGKTIDLRPREAEIVKLIIGASRPLAACHHGLMVTDLKPEVTTDPVDVIEIIERLRDEDFLTRE